MDKPRIVGAGLKHPDADSSDDEVRRYRCLMANAMLAEDCRKFLDEELGRILPLNTATEVRDRIMYGLVSAWFDGRLLHCVFGEADQPPILLSGDRVSFMKKWFDRDVDPLDDDPLYYEEVPACSLPTPVASQ